MTDNPPDQPGLFGPSRAEEIFDAWLEFHQQNPEVLAELASLVDQLLARGHQRYGIGSLFEVVRWHRALETTDEEFKLNNNHRALYARLLMARYPRLEGFFEIRRRNGDLPDAAVERRMIARGLVPRKSVDNPENERHD